MIEEEKIISRLLTKLSYYEQQEAQMTVKGKFPSNLLERHYRKISASSSSRVDITFLSSPPLCRLERHFSAHGDFVLPAASGGLSKRNTWIPF